MVRAFIRVVAGLLATFFIFLKWDSQKVIGYAISATANSIIEYALAIYFISWVLGSQFDTSRQEDGCSVSDKSKPTQAAFGMMALIAIIFGIICWIYYFVKGPEKIFYIMSFLGIFIIFNILGYMYMLKTYTLPNIIRSFDEYIKNKDKTNFLKLSLITEYISGRWQWIRLITGLFLCLLITCLILYGSGDYISPYLFNIPPNTIYAIMILFYILFIEMWMWCKRVWIFYSLRNIDKLAYYDGKFPNYNFNKITKYLT